MLLSPSYLVASLLQLHSLIPLLAWLNLPQSNNNGTNNNNKPPIELRALVKFSLVEFGWQTNHWNSPIAGHCSRLRLFETV